MSSASSPLPSRTHRTRASLIDAAERLIAEAGTGVALRDISAAAGQRNHSAAHYHFGSREGLIEAVIVARSAAVDSRRAELLALLDPAAPREQRVVDLIGALLDPWLEMLADGQGRSTYLRFSAQCLGDPDLAPLLHRIEQGPASLRAVNAELAGLLGDLPPQDRLRRLAWLHTVALTLLAQEERGEAPSPAGWRTVRADLVAMLAVLLQAPTPSTAPTAHPATHPGGPR